MNDTILFPEKFRGPPKSGNGGYVAGKIAAKFCGRDSLGSSVEVTLRAPTPLDRTLALRRTAEDLRVFDGETLIAECRAAPLDIDVPTPASWEEALSVQKNSYSFPLGINPMFDPPLRGVHPICYCCGAELGPSEGAH